MKLFGLIVLILSLQLRAEPPSSQPALSPLAMANEAEEESRLQSIKETNEYHHRLDQIQSELVAKLKEAQRQAMLVQSLEWANQIQHMIDVAMPTVAVQPSPQKVDTEWAMLFRSDDPTIWNTSRDDGQNYAVALKGHMEIVTYLRYLRADTNDFVIIKLPPRTQVQGLAKTILCGKFQWNGTARYESFNGGKSFNYLLGIAQMDRYAHYHHDAGCILIEVGDREGYLGWGFGKDALVFSGQKYGWNGDAIDKTPFEVDVTNGSIATDEQSHLLGN